MKKRKKPDPPSVVAPAAPPTLYEPVPCDFDFDARYQAHLEAAERERLETRFWRKVERGEKCWLWLGAYAGKYHYGRFVYRGVTYSAHRMAYELERGPIVEGMTIDHLCNNPSCVRPRHLEVVTLQENIRRAVRRRALRKLRVDVR